MKRLVQIVIFVFMLTGAFSLVACAGNAADPSDFAANDPLNATYLIEGQDVRLVDGRCERPAAPDSATKTRTIVLGQPVAGDLDGTGGEDAVVLLRYDPGGSGIFYCLAAAISGDRQYKGTNAVLLGDRIVPRDIKLSHRVVVVRYTDRLPAEPMSAYPTIDKIAALALVNGQLTAIGPLLDGHVTIGHEVRAFQPCNGSESLWLVGTSPALREITAAYRRMPPDKKHYRPVFAVLAGKRVAPPPDGFGADYEAAFRATHLVKMAPGENCSPDVGRTGPPSATEDKISFDVATFDEDGLYGPTGAKRALSYAFCIPAGPPHRSEVAQIDQTVAFYTASPGRTDCGTHEILCIGSTHQKDYRGVLRRLAQLPYVQRINQSFFE